MGKFNQQFWENGPCLILQIFLVECIDKLSCERPFPSKTFPDLQYILIITDYGMLGSCSPSVEWGLI